MKWLRRALRSLLVAMAVVVAAAVLLCAVVLAVNRHDRPPTALALALAAASRARPAVADPDNAYVYLLGLEAPRDADPAAIGAERAAWIRALADGPPGAVAEQDPFPPPRPFGESGLDDAARERNAVAILLRACGFLNAGCVAALEAAGKELEGSLAPERWRIERYRQLLAYGAWRDVTPNAPSSVVDPLLYVRSSHELFLLDTWRLASHGDAQTVRERLDADLALWRLALGDADSWSDRAVVGSFIRRSFEWGNLILRRLPPTDRAAAIPTGWRRALTPEERSLQRMLVGEWNYRQRALATLKATGALDRRSAVPHGTRSLGERLGRALTQQLLQVQDCGNRDAATVERVSPLLDAAYADLPSALTALKATKPRRSPWLERLYNPLGRILAPEWSYRDLARQSAAVADLEALRRAALLTAELRARDVSPEIMADAVQRDDLRDPYSGEPFRWDADARSIELERLDDRTTVGLTRGLRRGVEPTAVLY